MFHILRLVKSVSACKVPCHLLVQGVPNLGYICLSEGVHLLYSHKLILRNKNRVYLHISKNLKVLLKIQWVFVTLISLIVIRNFRSTWSSVEKLKGYMVRERLGTPELVQQRCQHKVNEKYRFSHILCIYFAKNCEILKVTGRQLCISSFWTLVTEVHAFTNPPSRSQSYTSTLTVLS